MIKNINIVNFGKLSDICISPSDKLNIIYAPNEGGKSTLLDFIKFIFYGSRQKKSKGEIPFREKYMPWNGMPMSGSIELDYNGNSYIIYRSEGAKNGSKQLEIKNPHTGERYTNIDDPGQFFFGVGEKVFSDTFLSLDTDVFLNPGEDIASIVYGMGDFHSSYSNIRQSLEEQILDISSPKRSGSDFSKIQKERRNCEENILRTEKEYEISKNDLSEQRNERGNLEEKQKYLNDKLSEMQKDEESQNYARILALKQKETDNLKKLQTQLDMLKKGKNISDGKKPKVHRRQPARYSLYLSFTFFLAIAVGLLIKGDKVPALITLPFLILFALLMIINDKKFGNKNSNDAYPEENSEDYYHILSGQIEMSNSRINEYEEEIKKISILHNCDDNYDKTNFDVINTFTKEEINGIINKVRMCEIDMNVLDAHIKSTSSKMQEIIAEKKYYQSVLSDLDSRLEQLNYKVKVLTTALSVLDSSFFAMRDSIAPKISQRAFEIFDKVCGSGYTALVANDKFEASINVDGELKSVRNFSRSTRDLADLALRIAICDALSDETSLPIFFDDVLSSFDDDRSLRMLECIRTVSDDRQVFMCTCRMREVISTDPKVSVIKLGKDDNNG